MNLILAVVWLLLAVVLSSYEAMNGPFTLRVRLGGANYSLAWVMLVLGLYNVARWYSVRLAHNEQRAMYESMRRRLHALQARQHPEPAQEPDPNLRFTDEPAPPTSTHLRDQPPSAN